MDIGEDLLTVGFVFLVDLSKVNNLGALRFRHVDWIYMAILYGGNVVVIVPLSEELFSEHQTSSATFLEPPARLAGYGVPARQRHYHAFAALLHGKFMMNWRNVDLHGLHPRGLLESITMEPR